MRGSRPASDTLSRSSSDEHIIPSSADTPQSPSSTSSTESPQSPEVLKDRKKEITGDRKPEPSGDALDFRIPDDLLAHPQLFETKKIDAKSNRGSVLAKLILDIFRSGDGQSRKFYFGSHKAEVAGVCHFTPPYPDEEACQAVLSGSTTEVAQREEIELMIAFLKKQLTEEGFEKLLDHYNQTELNYFHVPLFDLKEQKNAVWRGCKTQLHFQYAIDEQQLEVNLRASDIKSVNAEDIEGGEYYLLNKDTELRMKSVFMKEGTVERELYTSTKDRLVLNQLVDVYLQEYLNTLQKLPAQTLFAKKQTPANAQYKRVIASFQRNQSLHNLLLQYPALIPQLIEHAVDLQYKILPIMSDLSRKEENLRHYVSELKFKSYETEDQKSLDSLRKIEKEMVSAWQGTEVLHNNYYQLLAKYAENPDPSFVEKQLKVLQELDKKINFHYQQIEAIAKNLTTGLPAHPSNRKKLG